MTRRLPSAPPLLPGLDYVRPLGSGGFADVFLYQQDMPRRQVAVKVLPIGERDPDLLRMFNAEADVLAHLSAHPAIVTVYQAGISADGRPYIVMEFCPGSLRCARVGASGRADPPRHQAEQHPHHDVRVGGARRLRHLVDPRPLSGG